MHKQHVEVFLLQYVGGFFSDSSAQQHLQLEQVLPGATGGV